MSRIRKFLPTLRIKLQGTLYAKVHYLTIMTAYVFPCVCYEIRFISYSELMKQFLL
jgi:hypothetical protein